MSLSVSEFVSLVEQKTGKKASKSGQKYKCCCPAHPDDKASLSVSAANNGGILFKCFAGSGCEKTAILAALNLKWSDVLPPKFEGGASEWQTIDGIEFPSQHDGKRIVAAYIYADAFDKPKYAVLRTMPKGDFPQGRIVDNKFEYGLQGQARLLFHLSKVIAAANHGQVVHIVEGEKDVLAIESLNGVATCNSGGAGRWDKLFSNWLKGARVVIVRDKDGAGKDHAKVVAASLREHNIPYSIVESAAGKDAADHIAAGFTLDEFIMAEDEPYLVMGGKLFHKVKNKEVFEFRQLANFDAKIVRENFIFNGHRNETWFDVEGTIQGMEKQEFEVRAAEFSGLNWVIEKLGSKAIISPGAAVRDQLRTAIQTLSDPKLHMIYAQSGWQEMPDGKKAFVTGSGAITEHGINDKVEVDMARVNLAALDIRPTENPYPALLALSRSLSSDVWVPLVGTAFLAPLRPFVDPDYALFICGESGKFKSEVAAIGQAFFGKFKRSTLPANFESTANYVEAVLHAGKDCIIVVDDYYPSNDRVKGAQLATTLDRILRGVGNSSSRGRLNADSMAKAGYTPQAIPVITAEKLPVGQSNSARAYIVELQGAIIEPADLTQLQHFARKGEFAGAMYEYIRWIARNWDRLAEEVPTKFEHIRNTLSNTGHRRTSSNSAWVLLGTWAYTQWLTETGKAAECGAGDAMERAVTAADIVAAESGERINANSYPEMFRSAVQEGLVGRKIHLRSRSGGKPMEGADKYGWDEQSVPGGDMVGYIHEGQVWLMPDAIYAYVYQAVSKSGLLFGIDKTTLFKRLDDRGWLAPGERVTMATINGQRLPVVRVARHIVDGSEAPEAVLEF